MGAIIQTLTLAIVLLIIGLVCTVLGFSGLVWRTGRDRRRMEQAEKATAAGALADGVVHQSVAREKSLKSS